jgi:predicted adenine nucleotide alpha hydrolase (AANH) superfamily ATPase
VAKEYGARWLPSDFKKKDGENRSIELCEQYDVYRQLYCGCEYSIRND